MAEKSSSKTDFTSALSLLTWKENALTWILRGLHVLATPLLVFGIINLVNLDPKGEQLFSRSENLNIFFLAAYLFISWVAYAPHLNYVFRAISTFGILFTLGSILLLVGGLASNALIFFLATMALTAIFLDRQKALIVQMVGIFLISLIAGLFLSGRLLVSPFFRESHDTPISWGLQGVNYLVLSTLVFFSISILVKHLEESFLSAQKQTEHLSFLHETAFDILAHKEMPELLDALIKRSVELVGATGGLFFLVDEDGEGLTMVASSGEKSEKLKKKVLRGDGVAGRVLENEQSMLILNYDLWDEHNVESEGMWGSIIETPVILDKEVIGILGCYTLAGDLRDFDESDIELMEGVSRQASMAIENLRLIDAAQQAGARLDTVVQTAPSAIISVNLKQRIIMFNQAAEDIFGYTADEALGKDLNFLMPERFHFNHSAHVDGFSQRPTHAKPMLVPRELTGLRANGEEFPIEIAVSKSESNGKVIMTVIMQDITERKKARDALQKNERRAQILLTFSKNLEASGTFDEIFQAALNVVENVLGYRNIWFYLYSEDRSVAKLLATAGEKDEFLREYAASFLVETDPLLSNLAEKFVSPQVIEDARTDPHTDKKLVELSENRTIVHVPVFLMNRDLGLLGMGSFGDEGVRVPTAGELDFLATMASHIAISIDRVKYAEEQRRSEARLMRSHKNQLAINELLQVALQDIPLKEKLSKALDVILSTSPVAVFEKGIIFLFDDDAENLILAAHKNMGKDLLAACLNVQMGFCLCGRAAQDRQIKFAAASDVCQVAVGEPCHPYSHYSIPILLGDDLQGILMLHLAEGHEQDVNENEYLMSISHTLANLIDRAKAQEKIKDVNEQLVQAYDSTLEGWAKALDYRDKETSEHTVRVADMTVRLARAMNISEGEIVHIRRGALLHDIGKMSISDATLKKGGYLSAEEWKEMQKHPQSAYDMLSSIAYLEPALDIPYCHHEKWDGSGYPRGLKGVEIPLAARMFSVVDVWDALSSDRPYRRAWSERKIINYIRERSGTQFDPQVVDAFLKLIGEE